MPSITGQSIVIIRGSAGIGLAVAKLALKKGARVTIVSSNPTRINTAINNLKEEVHNCQITSYKCNLKAEDVKACREKVFIKIVAANNGNSLDHIIFTAGDQLANH
jgi:NAD(P)-dependent dehydrogenase (short-subunit alcohol dehydrogenase family)